MYEQHFDNSDNLNDHIRSKHDQSLYKCCECGETFDNERTLSEHVGRSHEVNRDKCERCGENIQEQ